VQQVQCCAQQLSLVSRRCVCVCRGGCEKCAYLSHWAPSTPHFNNRHPTVAEHMRTHPLRHTSLPPYSSVLPPQLHNTMAALAAVWGYGAYGWLHADAVLLRVTPGENLGEVRSARHAMQ